MRILFCVLCVTVVVSSGLVPSASAQTMLKTEPHYLAPYSIVFVDNGSCRAGKVLKVRGGLRAMPRKKTCVPIGREAASLSSATPLSLMD